MPHIRVENIQKRFNQFIALDGVSLEIKQGELVCLLGPSGCGKTTLLRCIAGLETQDHGSIFNYDNNISHLPPQARDYGILFQSYALFPNLTVQQNIAYGLAGQPRNVIKDRVNEMLELVGLQDRKKNIQENYLAVNNSAWHWLVLWLLPLLYYYWMSQCRH